MYVITSFGVINILVYGGWGSNFNTCANMVNEDKKKIPNAFFTFLNFLNTKNNQSIALGNFCTRNYNIKYLPPHYYLRRLGSRCYFLKKWEV